MTITPELAQEWLDRGGTNRKITRRRIEAMTAAIQRGEWRLPWQARRRRLSPILVLKSPIQRMKGEESDHPRPQES